MTVVVSGEVAHAAEKKAMYAGEQEDQDDFGLQPA